MEGSPQTLPRSLERKAVRKLRQPSVQIYVPFLVEFVGGTQTFHAGGGTVRRVPPLPPNPAAYVSPNSRSLPGAVILSATYGIDVKSSEDPLLKASLEATRAFVAATVPGKFLVDIIPMRASRRT